MKDTDVRRRMKEVLVIKKEPDRQNGLTFALMLEQAKRAGDAEESLKTRVAWLCPALDGSRKAPPP